MTEPRVLRVELPSFTVSALEWGPTDGRLAVLVHGFPDTAWTWRRVAPLLAADGWRVVAPFTRGYAPTGPAPDGHHGIGAVARDVLDLHRALGSDPRAMLVGHDWGAEAAYAVAGSAPDAFAHIVTLAVPPVPALVRGLRGRTHAWRAVRQARHSWYIALNQLPGVSETVLLPLARHLWSAWSPGYDAGEELAHLAEALPTRAHRRAAVDYYRHTLQPWRRSTAYAAERRAAERVPRGPFLYLHGADDGCILADLAPGVADVAAPGSVVEVVRDAGHFLQLEQPGIVADLVLRFAATSGSVG